MKNLQLFSILSLSLLSLNMSAESTFNYRQEFESFKNSPRYEAIFNEDAPAILSDLQANIEIYKELSWFQRFVRSAFFALEPVVINAKTMPTLHAYIDTMCKSQGIATPTIFVTRDITWKQGFFNAAAQKLLMSSGAIVIGQKMLLEVNDAELEAVVAHEIGHIKYNHINKQILITYLSMAGSAVAMNVAANHYLSPEAQRNPELAVATRVYAPLLMGLFLTRLIINKQFEKQADEFAYKVMGKGEGMVEFFEDLKNRDKNYNDYFAKTYTILQESKKDLNPSDSLGLTIDYYLASFGNKLNNAFKWLYHNTPYGAHPSHDARIEAAKNYMASQAAHEAQN